MTLLNQEVELANKSDGAELELLSNWPALPAVLGRAASVFRPPPGTSPQTTAGNAISVILDVLEHVIATARPPQLSNVCLSTDQQKILTEYATMAPASQPRDSGICPAEFIAYELADIRNTIAKSSAEAAEKLNAVKVDAETLVDETMRRNHQSALVLARALRGIVSALQGNDVTTAIVELAGVFESAIVAECAARKATCAIPVTTAQLRRGFRILSALAAYGASYRQMDGAKDAAQAARVSADERRKAVESLIEAVTDRSERYGDWIVSLGSNVAITADTRMVKGASDYFNKTPFSLKTGLALEWLPGPRFLFDPGLHFMFSFLDLTQYAAIGGTSKERQDGDSPPEPRLASALRLGLEAGVLVGDPTFPLALTGHFGLVPEVDYGDGSRAEWSAGGSLGIFVPFIDFN
ncbi:MAG TPA: hypothetical protein VK524_28275 [Polyangiaceae bacterium]|nr:hypothetical protein [Polyangiaceae bacterium]